MSWNHKIMRSLCSGSSNDDVVEVNPTPTDVETEPANAQESIQKPVKEMTAPNVDFSNCGGRPRYSIGKRYCCRSFIVISK